MTPLGEKLNKSPQADKNSWYFQYVAHVNNNSYADFRTAYKHVLIPSYVIQVI